MSSLLTMALSAQQHQFFRSSCRRFTELLGSLRAIAAVFIVLAICAPQVAAADDRGAAVGKVLSARGATAHVDGGAVRFLGRGDPIYKGDVISTARRSFAVIKMVDKTNVTVRPKTVLRFDNLRSSRSVKVRSSACFAVDFVRSRALSVNASATPLKSKHPLRLSVSEEQSSMRESVRRATVVMRRPG